MKNFFSLLVLTLSFAFVFTACSSDDNDPIYVGDGNDDTIAEVYEYKNATFNYDSSVDEFYFKGNLKLYNGEHSLIYIQSGYDNGPVWKLLPNYANYNENNLVYSMNYNYDFTSNDFEIYAWSDPMPLELKGITFRVVIIPGYFPSSKSYAPPVDYRDYKAVVEYFKIDESKVKVVNSTKAKLEAKSSGDKKVEVIK